ncbi:uncharacterized protein [Paramisgurnus dabryanus]|uniref:uncharacterized protein n=1 Tax=Paramisgurnus dabryanus TaxID=90735 RepID=UPI0031F452E8
MGFGQLLMMTILMSKTESRSVFVQTGSSLQMDIQHEKLPQFKLLTWFSNKTDGSENLVKFTKGVFPPRQYIERVNFNNESFSLTLRNMQKTDSGVYGAKTTGDEIIFVAEYNVLVIDQVVSPVLTLLNYTLISINSCAINVTCSSPDLTLSSSYHSNNCSQQEVTSSELHTLTLYCNNDIVACNSSNPVSWKNETIDIQQICTARETVILEDNSEEDSRFPSLNLLIVIAISATVLLLAGTAVLYCSYQKYKKGAEESHNTVYAEVGTNNEVQGVLEMSERSANLQTVYSVEYNNMQSRQKRISKSEHHIYDEFPEMMCPRVQGCDNNPQTTYCKVGQHRRPPDLTENNLSIYSVVSKLPEPVD